MDDPSSSLIKMNNSSSSSPKFDELNSTLIIKLKLPKLELNQNYSNPINNSADFKAEDELEEGEIKDEEDDELPPPPPLPPLAAAAASAEVAVAVVEDVKLRICPFCDKSFTNGKALGGHMRIHAEKKKTGSGSGSGPDPNQSPNLSPEAGGRVGEVFKCELCPKDFPSAKSLFGHMRSHPERHYRGMNPPKTPPPPAAAAEARLRSLGMTWKVTGKRGRVAAADGDQLSPVTSSSSTSFGSNAEAAADLMFLLNGKRENATHDNLDGYEDDEEVEKARKKKGKGLMYEYDEDEIYYLKNMGFLPDYKLDDDDYEEVIKVNHNLNDVGVKVIISPPSTPSKMIKGSSNNNFIKKVNFKNIKDDNYNDNQIINKNINFNNNKWVCNTCGKSFPTHQALGGHRSSHNKDKYNNNIQTRVVDGSGLTDTGPSNGNNSGGEDGQTEVVAVNVAANDEVALGVHKCKICDKTFTSGQALGGHQRCHYVPFFDVTFSSGQTCQTSQKGLFDLNVEPPIMDDGGDVTFDSSCSKYNCSY